MGTFLPTHDTTTKEITMGMFSAITKGALAKKAIEEGRKPENQAKIKSAISSMRNKKSGGSGTTGRGTRAV